MYRAIKSRSSFYANSPVMGRVVTRLRQLRVPIMQSVCNVCNANVKVKVMAEFSCKVAKPTSTVQ